MTSLYEALGSSPGASQEQLRQAYRRAARRLHPDVNPDPDTSNAMRALNEAWAVLGNTDRRRRYDAELRLARAPSVGPTPSPAPPRDDDDVDPGDHRRGRWLRPSVVIVAVLGIIFVVTAYAAPSNRQGRSTLSTIPTPSTVSAAPALGSATAGGPSTADGDSGGVSLVGKCILKLLGYDAIVGCNESGAQLVVAEVATSTDCPAGTTVYQLEGRSQLVCLSSR